MASSLPLYCPLCSNFGDFQEPYYRDYIDTPLAPLFVAAGLRPGMKVRPRRRHCTQGPHGPLVLLQAAHQPPCLPPATPPRLLQVMGSSTKTLSFTKPTEDDQFAVGGNATAAAQAAAAEVAAEALQDE